MFEIVAIISVIGFLGISIFQFLLVLGYPLGHLAYGGNFDHQPVPKNYRITSAFSIGVYLFFSLIVLEYTNFISIFNEPTLVSNFMWIIAIFLSLGVVKNSVSRSKPERNLWTPIVFVLALCSYVLIFFS